MMDKLKCPLKYKVLIVALFVFSASTAVMGQTLPILATPEFVLSANSTRLLVTLTQAVENATDYELVLRVGDSGMLVDTAIILGDERLAREFTDLMPDTTYTVSVIAVGNPDNYRTSEAAEQSVRTLGVLRLRLRVFLQGPLQ